MTLDAYLAYCAAATALALVPGPTVTVIIANSLRHGIRAGLQNVVGTQAGFVVWLAIAALGLSAAVDVMGLWFDLLRYAGAGYLIWLAIKLFRSDGNLSAAAERAKPAGSFVLQGFVVIISNPKMLVLFGAMIPPFISPGEEALPQILLLGGTFMAIAFIGDCVYAVMASKAGTFLSGSRIRALEIISGCLLMGGGLWMALKGR